MVIDRGLEVECWSHAGCAHWRGSFWASVLVAPVVALPLAVLFDRGPAGETRHLAAFLSAGALAVRRLRLDLRAQQRDLSRSLVSLLVVRRRERPRLDRRWPPVLGRERFCTAWCSRLLAVSPAFLALGLGGVLGSAASVALAVVGVRAERNAPGSASSRGVGCRSGSYGSGRPLPWGVALVALVTAGSVEQLEPSWGDAARLTGVRLASGLASAARGRSCGLRRPAPPRSFSCSRWPSRCSARPGVAAHTGVSDRGSVQPA